MTDPQARPLRRTPLTGVHERMGATLTGFAGWQMPLRYGSETAEHNAVRTAAGLFDLSHMGETPRPRWTTRWSGSRPRWRPAAPATP